MFGQDMSMEKTWVLRLGSVFDNIMIQNPSINGNTTRMALERMPHDVQSHAVDILLIGFGMNDCNYWETDNGVPRVSPLAFEANLKEIIERARVNGVKEIILHTNHFSPKNKVMCGHDFTYSESNARYNEIIRKVAKEDKEVLFADLEEMINEYLRENNLPNDAHVLPDGVHLNELGHNLYFEYILPCLNTAIDRIANR